MKVPSSLAIATALAASSVAELDAKFYGINYDFRAAESGKCKSSHAIGDDFNILKRVTSNVRIYGTDDCAKTLIGVARNAGLNVWLGLWSEVGTTFVRDGREQKARE
ncbi:hypothetical protein H257_11628 [Aphanomyces astaci]|uniref:glucan endo-1,3-beta-D-glucosidase n=1 Tax=Aphanomyces astaci TaxID=112090 RepID=W4G375_APHAT|nr:hypothetical protein H257_11628 [Aphanomyces astaci]ETV73504.1 hypothetical protein H257_11628 [Aphanomyces astaci]|eukprot:XP_009836930.1 hypothetical protein H257_11628 [Aphanomyces astaci]